MADQEDFEDISTYMYVETANGAPLFLPPTKQRDFFTIMDDDDHWNDLSMEAFSEPTNGDQIPLPPTDINQEYTLAELFGEEEAALSSDSDGEPQPENDLDVSDFNLIFDEEEQAVYRFIVDDIMSLVLFMTIEAHGLSLDL